ncbi:MAG: hypothetical protein OXN80_09035, partial [bacterium]|nr:hypothetical protein [bacterium]
MNTSEEGVTQVPPRLSSISDLETALAAARAGAKLVAAALNQPMDVFFKGDSDPVTEVDHRSERAILNVLSRHS